MFRKYWTYPDIQIWRYVHRISLYRYTAMFARQGTSGLFFGRHFLHPDKIPAPHFPFSGHRSKMRLTPFSPHAAIPPDSNKRILGHPHAKINASRLQYVILLLRIISSDNISNKSRRILSLNKPVIIANLPGSSCHHILCSTLHAAQPWLYYKHSTAAQHRPPHSRVRNLFSYGGATPVAPYPMHPSRQLPMRKPLPP